MQYENYLLLRPIEFVALYDRASTKPQATNWARGAHVDMAERLCTEQQWKLVGCYLDVGTGARADNRPQLDLALANEQVDTIVITDWDRLARGIEVCDALISRIAAHDKNLIIVYDECALTI